MPRKRKFEPEMGSERRNPSRKARPPEKFAVEEKSEPLTHRSPRTVDLRRLVEVTCATHTLHCVLAHIQRSCICNAVKLQQAGNVGETSKSKTDFKRMQLENPISPKKAWTHTALLFIHERSLGRGVVE